MLLKTLLFAHGLFCIRISENALCTTAVIRTYSRRFFLLNFVILKGHLVKGPRKGVFFKFPVKKKGGGGQTLFN